MIIYLGAVLPSARQTGMKYTINPMHHGLI